MFIVLISVVSYSRNRLEFAIATPPLQRLIFNVEKFSLVFSAIQKAFLDDFLTGISLF